jgi:hypothetical protein
VVDTKETADCDQRIHFKFIVTAQEIHWVVGEDDWRQKETVDDNFKKIADVVRNIEIASV